MKTSVILFFSAFLILNLAACSGGSGRDGADSPATGTPTMQEPSAQQRDSMRQLYRQFMAGRKDTLPLRQIQEAGKLYPVDEAPPDTSFFVFRGRLLQAIREKDLFHLMDIIHPDIKVDFGGAGGVADFVKAWQLDSPEKAARSDVWNILEDILLQGGTFQDNRKMFVAPYIFAAWPDKYDAFEYWAITGSGVRLRSAPNLQSSTLTMVSYDIVKFLEQTPVEETIGGETHPWIKIQLADETEGYVYGKFAAPSIGYRTAFERQPEGNWLMVFLVAGD